MSANYHFPIPESVVNNNTIVRRATLPLKKKCDDQFLSDPCCGWNETHCSADTDYYQPVCAPALNVMLKCGEKAMCEDTGAYEGEAALIFLFNGQIYDTLDGDDFFAVPMPIGSVPFGDGIRITQEDIDNLILENASFYMSLPANLRTNYAFAVLYGEYYVSFLNELYEEGFLTEDMRPRYEVTITDEELRIRFYRKIPNNASTFCANLTTHSIKRKNGVDGNWEDVYLPEHVLSGEFGSTFYCCVPSTMGCSEFGMSINTIRIDVTFFGLPDGFSEGDRISITFPFRSVDPFQLVTIASFDIPINSSNPTFALAQSYVDTLLPIISNLTSVQGFVQSIDGTIVASFVFDELTEGLVNYFCRNGIDLDVYVKAGHHIFLDTQDVVLNQFMSSASNEGLRIRVSNGREALCCLGGYWQNEINSTLCDSEGSWESEFYVEFSNTAPFGEYVYTMALFHQSVNDAYENYSNYVSSGLPLLIGSDYADFESFVSAFAAMHSGLPSNIVVSVSFYSNSARVYFRNTDPNTRACNTRGRVIAFLNNEERSHVPEYFCLLYTSPSPRDS